MTFLFYKVVIYMNELSTAQLREVSGGVVVGSILDQGVRLVIVDKNESLLYYTDSNNNYFFTDTGIVLFNGEYVGRSDPNYIPYYMSSYDNVPYAVYTAPAAIFN